MHILLNLLPPKKKEVLQQGYIIAYVRALLVLLLIVAGVLSATLVSVHIILDGNLENLRQQTEDLLSEDTAPEKEIEVLGNFLVRVSDLQTAFIPWSEVIEEVARITPAGVVLDTFQLNNDGKVFLRGKAATRDDVLAFQSALESLPFFSEINRSCRAS